MKRILSFILALAMVLSVSCVAFADEAIEAVEAIEAIEVEEGEGFDIPERVEISFKVGDSTLMINGNPVEVETPYIAGEGTTLVPLRVITEAFGARVTWIDATKEIILEYPEVNITLQIGNINAIVNSHTEVLPVAPALSANGFTMVPLRFISETFGATVSYDEATAAITVVKENANANDTISSSTDLPRIGDSYWNWSMMTPQGMMMTERLSDGRETVFQDEENVVYLGIYEAKEDTYNDDFNTIKNNLAAKYSLSKADKGTDANGNKTMYFVARSKEYYTLYYCVYKDNFRFVVVAECATGSESVAALTTLVESFKVEFAADEAEKAQTYDLSNVDEDGYRTIVEEDLKLTFRVPAYFFDYELESLNTIFYVAGTNDTNEAIYVSVYSMTDGVNAKTMADSKRAFRDKYYNKTFSTVSEVHPYSAEELGDNAYYFWHTTKGLYDGDYDRYDVFFEKGEYVYWLTIYVSSGDKETFRTIMQSFSADVLNTEETGIFLYTEDENTTYTSSTTKWALTLNSSWIEYMDPEADQAAYINSTVNSSILMMVYYDGSYDFNSLRQVATSMVSQASSAGEKIVEGVNIVTLNNRKFYKFQTRAEEEDGMYYYTTYITVINGNAYIFYVIEDEAVANAGAIAEAEEIIGSLTVKK